MKILAIADINSEEPFGIDIPAMGIELVVSLGDVPAEFLDLVLLKKGSVPYYGVNGNEDNRTVPSYANIHLKVRKATGVRIGGFEGSMKATQKSRHTYSERKVARKLKRFPSVDLFIAHNPMAGVHDGNDPVHRGFEAFRHYVERHQPRLFLHGHMGLNRESVVGNTRVMAVSGKRIIDVDM